MEIQAVENNAKTIEPVDYNLEEQIEIDIAWFKIEGIVNQRTFSHKRIKPTWLNETVVSFSISGHVIALYVTDVNQLFRVDGSLTLHWVTLSNAFRKVYPNVTIN